MTLKCDLHTMPDAIAAALYAAGLRRNDDIGWITGVKPPATRHKRLAQMLDELARGAVYMTMPWHGGGR